jgi:hypothetical protein
VIDGLEKNLQQISLIFLCREWIKRAAGIYFHVPLVARAAQSDCFAYKNVAQVMRNQTQTQTNREDMFGVPNAVTAQSSSSSSW